MDHDLIVVGGGPVGASLARAAQGLSAVLVARARRVAQPRAAGFDARVYALSPGNMSFLQRFARIPAERLTAVHAMRIHGDGASHIEFDAYRAGVPELAWIVEDSVLQDALWDGLDAPVVEGRCAHLQMDGARALLRLADGTELAARLVVGADGAGSFVREQAGIGFTDRPYGQAAVVANFACERPHANTAYQWFQGGQEGGAVLALLPLPRNHVSMVWSLPLAAAERVQALASEALCREVEAATGAHLGQLGLVTTQRSYPLRRLAAKRLVSPRVALVGDAAHVVHPLAGQGLNLGLQDVRELLAVLGTREAARDPGALTQLRRYERARAEPILAMDAMIGGLFRLFGARGAMAGRLRNAGLNLTDRLPVIKNLLIRQAMN